MSDSHEDIRIVILVLLVQPVYVSAQDESFIRLQEIEGRTWLIDPSGRPFFAHGVTHIAYRGGIRRNTADALPTPTHQSLAAKSLAQS